MIYLRVPVARQFTIPHGDPGTEATVRHMRRLAREAAPLLGREAERIVSTGWGSETDRALRLREWLATHTRYADDPEGVELIRTPAYMLREIRVRGEASGDCDDVAVLGAALGLALGFRARFKLLGFTAAGPYEHVYTELLTGRGPVDLDTTRPERVPPTVRVAYVEV